MADQFRGRGLPRSTLALALAACLGPGAARADLLDDIGVNHVRQVQPTLTGSGVIVAHVEASLTATEDPPGSGTFVPNNDFEVNNLTTHGIPTTYINATGQSATVFPNTIGTESAHSDVVGGFFYGTGGVVPGIASIFNIEADYFLNDFVSADAPITAKVVNQSFGVTIDDPKTLALYEQVFDNYVVQRGIVVVSGAGNGGPILFPASFMNGIAVGAYQGANSTGPTTDGRAKPDIAAPAQFTSYAAPMVSGISVMLVQAGTMGLGGANTAASSVDPRTVKALLLTGAIKPSDWSASPSVPLDTRYGTGIVNAYASYTVLTAGKAAVTTTTQTTSLGGAHDAVNSGATLGFRGWNLKSLSNQNSNTSDAVDHYLMDLSGNNGMNFTATLDWYHPFSQSVANGTQNYTLSGLNNLDLYLYDAVTNTRVAASASTVNNVEHVFVPVLPSGRYDLQVLKRGGGNGSADWVSVSETYALAWRATLLGDANLDGVVNAFDLNILATNWQSSGKLWTQGDFTGDGVVNAFDLNALAANWQIGSGVGGSLSAALQAYPMLGTTSAVPEPASFLLLGLGVTGTLLRRQRRRV